MVPINCKVDDDDDDKDPTDFGHADHLDYLIVVFSRCYYYLLRWITYIILGVAISS